MSNTPVELSHNLSPKAFKWLWMKYVTTVNDNYHCTNCLRGRYGKVLSDCRFRINKASVQIDSGGGKGVRHRFGYKV